MRKEKTDSFWDKYEWEFFSETISLSEPFDLSELDLNFNFSLDGLTEINIKRDDKYRLVVTALGIIENAFPDDDKTEVLAGTRITNSIIKGTYNIDSVELSHCFVKNINRSISLRSTRQSEFEANIEAAKIELKSSHMNENSRGHTVVEWYLNGPFNTVMYCDNVKKETSVEGKRTRRIIGEEQFRLSKRESMGWHSLCVRCNGLSFFINEVDKRFEPDWSGKLSIEYRQDLDGIPDRDTREAIAELIGFLIGRNISYIGETHYDESGNINSAIACSPKIHNLHEECRRSEREIVPIHYYHNERENLKNNLEHLLPTYISLRKRFSLNESLHRYWLAYSMPIGINLPILSSALEGIMKGWFRSEWSKSKAEYMPNKKYHLLMSQYIEDIRDTLSETIYLDRIVQKIKNANQMGANEQFIVFLDEIGLNFGDAEKSAIKARNTFAHGNNSNNEDEHINALIKNTDAFFLLYGRSLLKLLGYEGEYIDNTILGYPRKNIIDPIGKTETDV